MTFQSDVMNLKKHLDEINSIGEIRSNLLKRDLRLIVSIYTRGIYCIDWDITDKKLEGILDLGIRIKLSKLSDDDVSTETLPLYPVTFNQIDWTDQEDLFEKLKQGIKTCIKRVGV